MSNAVDDFKERRSPVFDLGAIKPVLDDSIDKAHSVDDFIQIASVAVVSVVVSSLIRNVFHK